MLRLKGTPHRIFPAHFAPGKHLFHVVVKLSDAPGSYSRILDLLRTKLNLIGTSTYTLSDGTAIFSGFAEALNASETGESLQKLIMKSDAAIEAEVRAGKDGLLIDTYHQGFAVDGDRYMLLRREEMAHMFNHVSMILGSGGEALLYEEGRTTGKWNAETFASRYGAERLKTQVGAVMRMMTAHGLGNLEGTLGPGKGEITVTVNDCFECSDDAKERAGCNFMRGYLAGAAVVIFGKKHSSVETECVLKGAKRCVFRVAPEG